MVAKSILSAGLKTLTKGMSKKALKETTQIIGKETMQQIGELVARNPEKAGYAIEVLKKQNFKGLNELQQEAASMAAKSRSASLKSNFTSGNYTRPDAVENLQAAGADRLTGRKRTPRTIQGPVPPKLADKTFDQGAQSYEEAVMAGTTKFTEDDVAKQIRNYGSDTAPHGRVTGVDVRKMSGRGTEARITWEKLLTLDEKAKGFYSVKLKGKEHAHHWNPIGVMKRVVEGLDSKTRNQLIAEAQDEFGLYSGNTMFNLRQLPTDIHDKLHKALAKAGYDPKKLKSFAKADYATRKEFLREFARVLGEIDERLFEDIMRKTHGDKWKSKIRGLEPEPEFISSTGQTPEMWGIEDTSAISSGFGGRTNISDRD